MTEAQQQAARAAGMTEEQIAALHLDSGAHTDASAGYCLLEAETVIMGLPFGDSDPTVDPVLAAFGRSWNDLLPDVERQTLKRYLGRLAGTNKGPELQAKRAFMALDWLWRTEAPRWMALVPELAEHAAKLRALAPITAELCEAERKAAIDFVAAAARAARDAWVAWVARAARDAWDARAAWDARDARAARDAWVAWVAWTARDARDARAAWDARDARDARDDWAAWGDAWDAAVAAATTVAYEAAKGCATYEEAQAKADAVFMAHRDSVQAELHDLYLAMINAELQEPGDESRAQAAEEAAP